MRYARAVSGKAHPLGVLGLPDFDRPPAEVRGECIRVGRRLHHLGRRVVGLLPASREVAVVPIALQIGRALSEVRQGATIGVVDANLRWPAMSPEAIKEWPTGPGGRDDDPVFTTRWLRPSLALLTPKRIGAAGAGLPELARVIQEGFELFAHMLVDLTGFRELGEYLAAIEMLDGVVVVARAGVTREGDLLRLQHALPASHNLGVLLVGGDPG